MDKQVFITGLRELAQELEPFINEIEPGQRIWNGTTWAVTDETKRADKYAVAWHSTLSTAADLLNLQDSSISAAQKEYFRKSLFGGMGSFQDFYVDKKVYGEEAETANKNLDLKLTKFFEFFE